MNLDVESQKMLIELVGNLIQIIAVIVGIIIVIYQVKKGHQNSLSLQNENIKNEHFSKLHAEIESVIEELSDTNVELSTCFRNIAGSFDTYRILSGQGIPNPTITIDTAQTVMSKKSALNNAVIRLISTVERHEIIEPRLKIFQHAFNAAFYDLGEAYNSIIPELFTVLPSDPNPQMTLPFRMPTAEKEQEITEKLELCINALDDIGSYTFDLRIEIQNLLLSDLYGRKLEKRKPIDPACRVISTEPAEYENLVKYFDEESPWGKHKQEIDNSVREQVAQRENQQ